MKIKTKITKAEYDALDDVKKGLYIEKNGSYVLDTDEADDLRRTLDAIRGDNAALKAELDQIKQAKDDADKAAREAAEEAARKKGDVTALEASWKSKVDEAERKGAETAAGLRKQIEALTVGAAADKIAAEISTVPELLAPLIRGRLQVEMDGETPAVRVLDDTGKLSAKTLEELKQEYVDNPKYAGILIGSKATGGGASGNLPGGAGGAKKISEMNEVERVAHFNKVGAAVFEQQLAAERNTAA